jgi:hypothetical protein
MGLVYGVPMGILILVTAPFLRSWPPYPVVLLVVTVTVALWAEWREGTRR